MADQKLSALAVAQPSSTLFLAGYDSSLPAGAQNVRVAASSLQTPAPTIGTVPGTVASGSANAGVILMADQGFYVGMGNPAADTAAMQACLAIATLNPGHRIFIPPGAIDFQTFDLNGLVVPSNTTICSELGNAITWNPGNNNNLWTSGTPTARTQNVCFEKIQVTGTQDTLGDTKQSGYPWLIQFCDGLEFFKCRSIKSNLIGIRVQYCTQVKAWRNFITLSGRDSLSVVYSSGIELTYNDISHGDDDGISAHSSPKDLYAPRERLLIAHNTLFDVAGISALGPVLTTIVENDGQFIKSHGVSLATHNADSRARDTEGCNAAVVVRVQGNRFADMIARDEIDKPPGGIGGCPWCVITGDAAQAGTLPGIPGFGGAPINSENAPWGVISSFPYFRNTTIGGKIAMGPSANIDISENTCVRTVPPCDGTVDNPLVPGTKFSKPSDWSPFLPNGLFTYNGWFNGPLSLTPSLQDYGVLLKDGAIRGVSIHHNRFSGLLGGVQLQNAAIFDDINIESNQIDKYTEAGVQLASNGTSRVYVKRNRFNADPEYSHPLRGANGTWIMPAGGLPPYPLAVDQPSGSGGLVVEDNYAKNVWRFFTSDTSVNNQDNSGVTNAQFFNNKLECWPYSTGYSKFNRGSNPDVEGGVLCLIMDFGADDPNYGGVNLGASLQRTASAMPPAGRWVEGRFLENTNAPVPVNGVIIRGWKRATTGDQNVPQVDWFTVLDAVYQAATIYTPANASSSSGTVVLSPNDKTSVLNNSGSGLMACTLPNGTLINDNQVQQLLQLGNGSAVTLTLNQTTQTITLDAPAGSPPESALVTWIDSLQTFLLVA